eukprot:8618153-Pyramimonas_sp.AAC.1
MLAARSNRAANVDPAYMWLMWQASNSVGRVHVRFLVTTCGKHRLVHQSDTPVIRCARSAY